MDPHVRSKKLSRGGGYLKGILGNIQLCDLQSMFVYVEVDFIIHKVFFLNGTMYFINFIFVPKNSKDDKMCMYSLISTIGLAH